MTYYTCPRCNKSQVKIIRLGENDPIDEHHIVPDCEKECLRIICKTCGYCWDDKPLDAKFKKAINEAEESPLLGYVKESEIKYWAPNGYSYSAPPCLFICPRCHTKMRHWFKTGDFTDLKCIICGYEWKREICADCNQIKEANIEAECPRCKRYWSLIRRRNMEIKVKICCDRARLQFNRGLSINEDGQRFGYEVGMRWQSHGLSGLIEIREWKGWDAFTIDICPYCGKALVVLA